MGSRRSIPVGEDAQHPLRGGEGAVGGEEDGDEGRVAHGEGVQEVEDQLLLRARLHTPRAEPGGLQAERQRAARHQRPVDQSL